MVVNAISEEDMIETYCKHCKKLIDMHYNRLFGCSYWFHASSIKQVDQNYKVEYKCNHFEKREV